MYLVHVPRDVKSPAPLVVMLHGGFGSAQQAERSYGWDDLADREGFVIAYPNGVGRAWNTTGGCCGEPARNGVDDVGFITAVVKDIDKDMRIDSTRVYATGMSNGAIMTYTLACRTSIFAAIAPVAGTQLGDCSRPNPTSVIHVHGTDDKNIPYDGSRGSGFAKIQGVAIPELDAQWRTIDNCAPPTVRVTGVATIQVAACANGRTVELVTVAGGGHEWPQASNGFDTTAELWRFLRQYSK